MLETQIGRIADALERLVVLMEKEAPAPAVKPAKKAAPEVVETPEPKAQPTEITLDALRKSLAPLDPTAGRALLEKFGVRKVSDLAPEQYMEVLKAAKAAK